MANTQHILEQLKNEIAGFEGSTTREEIGTVLEVGDGIAQVSGLRGVKASEMVTFEGGATGVALNLGDDAVGVIILGSYKEIKEGQEVRLTGKILEIGVGDSIVGRVVDPLGQAIDGKGDIKVQKTLPIERVAPGVISRQSVDQPVQTGIKAIDALVPVGRGQRELIIGDRQTGKTAIAIDAILNQRGQNMTCVYVAIGQKDSKLRALETRLREAGAMDYTVIVSAGASDPSPMQYLAPYAGVTIAEYFMEKGQDVLIIYDDLSSTQLLIVRFHFYFDAHQDVKHILETSSIYTHVFSNVHVVVTKNMVVDQSQLFQLSKHKLVTSQHTSQQT
jgi:F-type H+-transporting ATPase subunit alpha